LSRAILDISPQFNKCNFEALAVAEEIECAIGLIRPLIVRYRLLEDTIGALIGEFPSLMQVTFLEISNPY